MAGEIEALKQLREARLFLQDFQDKRLQKEIDNPDVSFSEGINEIQTTIELIDGVISELSKKSNRSVSEILTGLLNNPDFIMDSVEILVKLLANVL